ncbi:MAG: zinc ABC transporter substrate-binding protein [Cytophagales bacterium]
MLKKELIYKVIFYFATIVGIQLQAKVKVVTTTTILYDICKNIGGNYIETKCLMPVGGDPHIYEPTPADAQKITEADLIIKNGLHLEGWLNKLITAAAPQTKVIEAANGIEPIKSNSLHGSPDPHAWMDPILGIKFATNIALALEEIDFDNREIYKSNLKKYVAKLYDTDKYIKNKIKSIPEHARVLVTTHDAFKYFGKRYGITVESAMGTSTDAEVQIADMNHLIKTIKDRKIPAVFVESTINPKLLTQMAKDNGIVVGGSLYADSIGDENSPAGSYIQMLTYNIDTIYSALTSTTAISEESQNKNETSILLVTVGALLLIAFGVVFFNVKNNKLVPTNWDNFNIVVNDVSTSYDRKTVLSNINLTLKNGKLYGLIGPNGAGKSTLFKSILGLIKPDRGNITVNNIDIKLLKDKIAYIPQKEEIDWSFPATVLDIVLMGRLPYLNQIKNYSKADYNSAKIALEKVGMGKYADRQIKDLSGGQQQRVFIARALCEDAKILMFDEPFVGVDVLTENKIIQLMKELVNENKTVIIIHHDLSKVTEYFDEVIMINQRLIAAGDTKQIFTQKNIDQTFGARLTILQERDKLIH